MFCNSCGSKIAEGMQFCSSCGAKVGEAVPADSRGGADPHLTAPVSPMQGAFEPQSPQPASNQAPRFQAMAPASQLQQPPVSQGSTDAKSSNASKIIIGVTIVIVLAIAVVVIAKLFIFDQQAASSTSMVKSEASNASSASQESDAASGANQVDLGFSGISSVVASSTLPTGGVNVRDYSAKSLLDGDQSTCWCENVPGVGIDETVTFSGPSEQTFHGFKIRNGHQDSLRLYYANARATSLRVLVDGKLMETVQLKDEGLNWQTITFAKPYTGKEITLQIASADPGSSYEDCCIADVEFF